MDAESRRFVLKPEGMGKRSAGHLNLTDFYHANNIEDSILQSGKRFFTNRQKHPVLP